MINITLSDAAAHVLLEPDPAEKLRLTRAYVAGWREGAISEIGAASPPARPSRQDKPALLSPRDTPKRNKGGNAGRAAFVHAIAHIECNAIDLAWDIIARFTHEDLPNAFYSDWTGVALDEAEHFHMLNQRLGELGVQYGDLPAHDGLWQAALDTRDDLLARLSIVPMILEARGLDTAPRAVRDLRRLGDHETAEILDTISREEVHHVATGVRWFEHVCHIRTCDPVTTFRYLLKTRFNGTLKPPFNKELRSAAGMNRAYYEDVETTTSTSGAN
jgi:uncharacterized ferritin-like protein (DUF455 family)